MSEPINEFHALTQEFVGAYHRLKADLTAGRAAIFTELDAVTEKALKTGLVEIHEPPAAEPVTPEANRPDGFADEPVVANVPEPVVDEPVTAEPVAETPTSE